ncbi:MAG: rhomboid family intramembrane serine protease [Candidatus Krumholzibacteriia bacterium]
MFFPLKDINPTERFPIVTIALIAVNAVVFMYEVALGPHVNAFIASWGVIPFEITHGVDLVGPAGGGSILHSEGPRVIFATLFSSMFIHGGFLHVFGNMLYLWIFGNNIEDLLGPAKFLLFYIACGLVAGLAHVLTQPNSAVPTVGASGAVAGVLGAYLIAYPRARVLTLVFVFIFIRLMVLPAGFLLVFWFVIQIFSGVGSLGAGSGVAWFAHIGGFVGGIVLLKLMARRRLAWLRGGERWR